MNKTLSSLRLLALMTLLLFVTPARAAVEGSAGFQLLNFDVDANVLLASRDNGYSIAGGAFWRPRWDDVFRLGGLKVSLAPRLGAELSKNALDESTLPIFIAALEPEVHLDRFAFGPDLGAAYILQDQDEGFTAMFGAHFAWKTDGDFLFPFIERLYVRYDLLTTTNTGHLIALGVGLKFPDGGKKGDTK